MTKNLGVKIILLLILALFVFGIGKAISSSQKHARIMQPFAQCLANNGATFYGAFWCPHCQAQKRIFGSAQKSLPYIECSNPDHSMTEACKAAGIEKYPTWVFSDGSRLTGEIPLEILAEKTACPAPAL